MNYQKGFVWLPVLLVILGVLAVSGGAYWYERSQPAAPQTPVYQESTTTPANAQATTDTVIPGERGTLLLGYKDIQLRFVSGVPQDVARGLCGLVYGDTCIWNEKSISEKPFYIYGSAQKQPLISVSSPNSGVNISYGTIVPIVFNDPGPSGRYRVYFTHHNLLGEVDEVHEAHIVSQSGDIAKTLTWDGNEVFVSEDGKEQVSQLEAGHYFLTVVNIDTGVEGSTSSWINLVTDIRGKEVPTSDLLKPYVAPGTPILNSYWDGRGVFMNGNAGVDTLTLIAKRSDIEIYRGIDMPSKNQYNTLVIFRRTDNVVVVITNVEILKLDDQTLYVSDLMKQLSPPALSVPGMRQYVESDETFGFSFWYPIGWTVTPVIKNVDGYGAALIKRTLAITGPAGQSIMLDEVYSPNKYIEIGSQPTPGIYESLYFDSTTHTWMHSTAGLSANGVSQPTTRVAANVSDNSMGGLHILRSDWGDQQMLVPLSATNFVVAERGIYNSLALLRTIVAADPSVANPASIAQQQATIEAEQSDYVGQ